MIKISDEELELVLRNCIDEIKRVQYKRREKRVLSYSDLILEMNATQTILMIEEVLEQRND